MGWEWQAIICLIVAAALGSIIGVERGIRMKEAGVRTHLIVALGSCLFTLISLSFENDVARIAGQIVTGIGFLGAGMIFFRRESIHGLTTAAGVWTTAGIGMAVACEYYILAVATTVIMILVQILLNSNIPFLSGHKTTVNIVFIDNGDNGVVEEIKRIFQIKRFHKVRVEKHEQGVKVFATIRTNMLLNSNAIIEIMKKTGSIESIEKTEA